MRKKPLVRVGTGGSSDELELSTVVELDEVGFEVTKPGNTQRFVKGFENGVIKPVSGAAHDYKPVLPPARYVWDLPLQQNREFVLPKDKAKLIA